MKSSIKNFSSKCDRDFLRIWWHLLKKSLMENFIFCAVPKEIRFDQVIVNWGKLNVTVCCQ